MLRPSGRQGPPREPLEGARGASAADAGTATLASLVGTAEGLRREDPTADPVGLATMPHGGVKADLEVSLGVWQGTNASLAQMGADLVDTDVRLGLSDSRWALIDLVEIVARQEGRGATLHIGTWNADDGHAARLRALSSSGALRRVVLYLDSTQFRRRRDSKRIRSLFSGDNLRDAWKCHGKFAVFTGGRLGTLVLGSRNLNSRQVFVEQAEVRVDAALAAAYVAQIEHVYGGGSSPLDDLVARFDEAGFAAGLSDGTWSLSDALDAMVARAPGGVLHVSAWNAMPEHVMRLREHVDSGRLAGVRLYVDESLRRRHRGRMEKVVASLREGEVFALSFHGKVAVMAGAEPLVLTTSANLNTNTRVETFELRRDAGVAARLLEFLARVRDAQASGAWRDPTKMLLDDTLDLIGRRDEPDEAAEPDDLRPPLYEGYEPVRAPVFDGRRLVDPGHDPCTDYARSVVSRETVAGPLVRAACQRHLDDLVQAQTRFGRPRRGASLYWSHAWYEDFRDFASRLRLWQAQFYAEPLILHPMQEFIFGSVYGWRMRREGDLKAQPETWCRRFRRAYLEVAKGNAKSPSLAVMGLYGLTADGEPGAEVWCGAAKMNQARIVMEDMNHISRVSALQGIRYMGIQRTDQLTHVDSASTAKLLSRDAGKNESGIKPHVALLDEVHEHRDGLLVSMMTRGFKFRRQPLLVMATNSGFSDDASVAREEHDAAKSLLTGEYSDDESFSYVCALDAGDEPMTDETCWPKANPMLGVSQSVGVLRAAVRDARTRPSQASDVRRLHFCQWSGSISGDWMLAQRWSDMEVDADIEVLRGVQCILGVDLSERGDMTATAWVGATGWTDDGKPVLTAVVRSYVPEEGLRERAHSDRMDYPRYVEEGSLRTTPGGTVEYETVAEDLRADCDVVNPVAVVYDGWRFKRFVEALDGADFPGVPRVDHPQSFAPRKGGVLRMSASIGYLERACAGRRFRVQANPIVRRAVSSVRIRSSDTGQQRFSKSHSTSRIDALIALTMATGAWEHVATGGAQSIVPKEGAPSKSELIRRHWRGSAEVDISLLI